MNYQKQLDQILTELSSIEEGYFFQGENIFWDNGDRDTSKDTSNIRKKPSLLLHACCGPCSSYVLEYLTKYFDITVFYYNPNIYPQEEYVRRFEELKKLYSQFPPALEGKVQVVEKAYNPENFYTAVGTRNEPELALEPEKGERCRRCYEFRLQATYAYARQHNYDYFCTTLSISPFKDAVKLNVIGEALETSVPSTGSGTTENPCSSDKRDRDNTDSGARDNWDKSDRDNTDSGARDNTRSLTLSKGPKWLPSDFKKKNGFKRSLEISEEYGMYRQDYCGCIYSKQNKKND